jgi:hypothetical protein
MSTTTVEHSATPSRAPRPRTASGPTAADAVLVLALAVLFAFDLVGGMIAITAHLNTASEAWGSEALLAAPLPMIGFQLVLTVLTLAFRGRVGTVAAALLSAACLISVASGFLDGGLGNDALDAGQSAYQIALLAVTGVVGVVAGLRAITRR